MWVKTASVDQRIHFYAPPGLTSFTIYRKRGNNAAVAMTTPTVDEDGTVPGLYSLLMDEDTTISSGKDTEEMVYIAICPGMTTQILKTVLYDKLPANTLEINSATVQGDGTSGDKWRGV